MNKQATIELIHVLREARFEGRWSETMPGLTCIDTDRVVAVLLAVDEASTPMVRIDVGVAVDMPASVPVLELVNEANKKILFGRLMAFEHPQSGQWLVVMQEFIPTSATEWSNEESIQIIASLIGGVIGMGETMSVHFLGSGGGRRLRADEHLMLFAACDGGS